MAIFSYKIKEDRIRLVIEDIISGKLNCSLKTRNKLLNKNYTNKEIDYIFLSAIEVLEYIKEEQELEQEQLKRYNFYTNKCKFIEEFTLEELELLKEFIEMEKTLRPIGEYLKEAEENAKSL